jgi:hypothetical protein
VNEVAALPAAGRFHEAAQLSTRAVRDPPGPVSARLAGAGAADGGESGF